MSARFVILTNVVSPHMIPLACGIAGLVGEENFLYLATGHITEQRRRLGWTEDQPYPWVRIRGAQESYEEFKHRYGVEGADCLFLNIRDWPLIRERHACGRLTYFSFERWFKPPLGLLRLLSPRYFCMAWHYMRELRRGHFVALPIGCWAARDMVRLEGLMRGRLCNLFCGPMLSFEKVVGGEVRQSETGEVLSNVRLWGYFIQPKAGAVSATSFDRSRNVIRVLWAGRFLSWKRVADLIEAVVMANAALKDEGDVRHVELDLYGEGPEKECLTQQVRRRGSSDCIHFFASLPIADVRSVMREHEVYVLSSNHYEGWGAVVSEALEEGMRVIGTFEAGSSETLLPETNMYHAGDKHRLSELLRQDVPRVGLGSWTPYRAARFLVEYKNV